MKVLIIEDEGPAARRLKKMLEVRSCKVLDCLDSVEEGVEWLASNEVPELIFSDIQLSDGISFEIFDTIKLSSPIIFTTAYDQYAIRAFKHNSIDYLLKPIGDVDLDNAITKYRKSIQRNTMINFEQLRSMLNPSGQNTIYKDRFMVKMGSKLKTVFVDDINAFYSEHKTTFVITANGNKYHYDETLEVTEAELNPDLFFRVNRKYIVKIDAVLEAIIYSISRLKLSVVNLEKEDIIVSREKVKLFKVWFGA